METGPQTSPDLSTGQVLSDAWSLYTMLFRRSIVIAAGVYVVIESLNLVAAYAHAYDARHSVVVVLIIASFVLAFAGPMLVQGALIVLVREVHEARRPDEVVALIGRAGRRIGSLTWAFLVYLMGIVFGLIALIVPGLLAFSRWSLMAPAIMLEGRRAGDARHRSRELVSPYTWRVCGTLVLVWAAGLALGDIPWRVVDRWMDAPLVYYALHVLSSALFAPFEAHVLSVLY